MLPAEIHAVRIIAQLGANYPPTHFMSIVARQSVVISRLMEKCHRLRIPLTGIAGITDLSSVVVTPHTRTFLTLLQ